MTLQPRTQYRMRNGRLVYIERCKEVMPGVFKFWGWLDGELTFWNSDGSYYTGRECEYDITEAV